MTSRKATSVGPCWPKGRPTEIVTKRGVRRPPCPIRRLTPLEEPLFEEADVLAISDLVELGSGEEEEVP